MRHADDIRRFIARTGLDKKARGEAVGVGVDLGNDVQPVGQAVVLEGKWHDGFMLSESVLWGQARQWSAAVAMRL